MIKSLYSGITGMKVNQTKLDVIGNNLANVSTTAFKSSRVNFSTTISQTISNANAATTNSGGVNIKQVGLGAQIASIDKIMSQGSMQSTSRALDVGVDGTGYFIVASGEALTGNDKSVSVNNNNGLDEITTNTNISYTRDGAFSLDDQGNLLTSNGYRVLGYAAVSEKDVVTGDITTNINANGEIKYVESNNKTEIKDDELISLKIPDTVEKDGKNLAIKSFGISSSGLITGVLETGEITVLGQLAMASFKNEEGLSSVGNNMYQNTASSGTAILSSGNNGVSNRESKGYGDILQGYLEMSGVDMTEQFTDMIVATKAFQAAGKTITTGDEILSEIINLKR
ncbi:MAG: flagellar hook-basal body complex protein [Clostridium sp.]|nr:flagellar hook-basal body complex protein [Clostridium sp.]